VTALDLITDSLTQLGEYAPGEPLSPEDANLGLTRLNGILDQWSVEKLLIFNIGIAKYTLSANVGTYTIGQGGGASFNAPRPIKIEQARIFLAVSGVDVAVKKLRKFSEAEWTEVSDPSASTALIPEVFYFDSAYPNGTLYIYPRPICSVATKVELSTWSALTQFATIADIVAFPPGYYNAVMYNLALQLGPAFNRQPDQLTAAKAAEGIEMIRRHNAEVMTGDMGAAIAQQAAAVQQ
jgi:hypothetical protein